MKVRVKAAAIAKLALFKLALNYVLRNRGLIKSGETIPTSVPTTTGLTEGPTTAQQDMPTETQKPFWRNVAEKQVGNAVDNVKSNLKSKATGTVKDYTTQNWQSTLRDLAVLGGIDSSFVDGPSVNSALKEGLIPALDRWGHSPALKPLKGATSSYLSQSSPEERAALFQSTLRLWGGNYAAPMWPTSSPWRSSVLPSYAPTYGPVTEDGFTMIPTARASTYMPNNPFTAGNKFLQRIVNPYTFAYDIPYAYGQGVDAGIAPSVSFIDLIRARNHNVADYIRTGGYALDSSRNLAEAGTYVMGPQTAEEALLGNLKYLSTGVPKGWSSRLWDSAPVVTDLADKGLSSLIAHGAGAAAEKGLSWLGAHAAGGPVSLAITLPVDAANIDGVIGNIEKQTSLNSYSNYDAKTNTYKAPFLIRRPDSTELEPSEHSIVMGPTTFGEHPYDLPKMFTLAEWGNNEAYKYQQAYLSQLQKADPENKRGIPYQAFYNRPFLPVFTEDGKYVLAIPPRTRTWAENAEDWKKWYNGEPITLREDQNWIVPVDKNGDPIPAKMPEDDRWFGGAQDFLGAAWHNFYNAVTGEDAPYSAYDPTLPLRLYGREVSRAHGNLSPHPLFTQLNEAWGTMETRRAELQERQNNLKTKVLMYGKQALLDNEDSPLVQEATTLIDDIKKFQADLQGLYDQESRLQAEYDGANAPQPEPPTPTGSSYLEMALPQAFMPRTPVPRLNQRVY